MLDIWSINVTIIQQSHGTSPFSIGKPSINGSFSMAMLNNQMVIIYTDNLCMNLYNPDLVDMKLIETSLKTNSSTRAGEDQQIARSFPY